MLLADGLGLAEEGAMIVRAIEQTLADGLRTVDIMSPGRRPATTAEFTDAVIKALRQ
jgi:isocitrate/isopropylmalate dehydrogenase